MKFVSWNVNGIRACLQKGFSDSVKKMNPDVLCLQEIKAHPEQVDEILDDFPHHFWNPAKRKGYSGVALFSKFKPLSVRYGFGLLDEEGRVITVEFENFFLVTVYTPNSKRDLERLSFRYHEWDKQFLAYVLSLPKPVIFCGDLNVAHQEIDLKNPSTNKTTKSKHGNAGFTDQEREGFSNILKSGFVDSFRFLHPDTVKYSWWSYMFQSRAKNTGWRIDYFCVGEELKERILAADILTDVLGSDHCPVILELK